MIKIISLLTLLISVNLFSAPKQRNVEGENSSPPLLEIPMVSVTPTTDTTVNEKNTSAEWQLEKVSTFHLETKVNVFVPLEIISDVEIKALVIDDQKLIVPFELEMNKEPDKSNFYSLNYSETEIDIDGDGSIDTKIYSPKYINQKIVSDNYLHIDGANISKEGVHKKRVYVTVELKEEVR